MSSNESEKKPAPKKQIDKKAMKSAKGGLNPQPLPPGAGQKTIYKTS